MGLLDSWYDEWKREQIRRQRHATPEEIGIPVPRTGTRRHFCDSGRGKSGVIANSHIVSHRYMSEGDKGKSLRREIKRKERGFILAEIEEGLDAYEEMKYLSSRYFDYDAYRMDASYGDFYDEYDWEYDTDEDYCDYCMGPCEL